MKITAQEFAEILEYCMMIPLTEKSIRRIAKTVGFPIHNDGDFNKIRDELYYVGMWLIVLTCEKIFKKEDKRNEYLEVFYHQIHGGGDDFASWKTAVDERYSSYAEAMKAEPALGPDWALAKLINKNLFGKVKEDPVVQTTLGLHIISFTAHLEQLLKELMGK